MFHNCGASVPKLASRHDDAGPVIGAGVAGYFKVVRTSPAYGSTAEAGALVGATPLAKAGPTVQVLLDWL